MENWYEKEGGSGQGLRGCTGKGGSRYGVWIAGKNKGGEVGRL